MNKELTLRLKHLPDDVQFYVMQDKDLQHDILTNNMTDEEIQREVDFQVEQMKQIKKPVTIRMNAYDIFRLKQQAKQQGIPYQTLINSYLHQKPFT